MASFDELMASPEGRAHVTQASRGARMHVVVYTDGSSRGNPGPGGYGSVLVYAAPQGMRHVRELSGGYRLTTNNRMELMGVIAALEALPRP